MFLFDTYAIIEIIRGNENYIPYLDRRILINNFIYAELCYILDKEGHPDTDMILEKYKRFIVELDPEIIRKAMGFRYKNRKKKLSITDCVSYFQAKEYNISFLTGDKEFEHMENVEFVK
ncbi:MAG: PIN domain-containing protein [Candidatus Woesearchaeota archaeon]